MILVKFIEGCVKKNKLTIRTEHLKISSFYYFTSLVRIKTVP